jgi:thiol:disulfide interchange protein DsbD
MEKNMFTQPAVNERLAKFELARLYTDGEGEPYESQQAQQQATYKTVALPFYAIVDGNGKQIAVFPGLTKDQNEFLAFLDKGLAN